MPRRHDRWRARRVRMAILRGATTLLGMTIALWTATVHAQTMDYSALENLFGEPVTTSATGSPLRASDVPASIIIVTADEIRRSGARDIPGILRHVPGVDVLRWTMDQGDVAVRGYNQAYSSRLLVLVDGRQVYADHYAYTPWSAIPIELSAIRQIEIVFGPNSALYGFNAVGGVINIVTYDPLFDSVNAVSVTGGTQAIIQNSAVLTHHFSKDFGMRLSVGSRNNDDYSTAQNAINIGTRRGNRRKSVDFLGHARFAHDIDFRLELSHSEAAQPDITPLYTAYYTKYRTSSVKGNLSADTGLGLLSLSAYMNWFAEDASAEISITPHFLIKNPVYVVQAQDVFKPAAAHTLRFSAEYRHNDMTTTPLGGAHVFYEVYSGAAMWSWAIDPTLSVTNAVRFDHLALGRNGLIPAGLGLTNDDWNRKSLTEVSFNSGIVWKVDHDDTLRFTAARGVQLPNLLNLGGLLLPLGFGYYGAGIPSLRPTVVTNYGLDLEHRIPPWSAMLRLRAFRQDTRAIVANFGGMNFPLGILASPANIGNSETTGAELSLQGTIGEEWRWGISYSPQVISDNFEPGFNVANVFVDYEHTHPIHVVNANLGWSRGPWEADAYLRYESEFQGIQNVNAFFPTGTLSSIPDYVSLDARLAYRLSENLTLSISGQNLLNSPQRQTSAAAVERQVFVSVAADF